MRALDDTIATLGSPLILRPLLRDSPQVGMVARWRHGAARVDIAPSNAIRIAMKLADGRDAGSRGVGSLADRARSGSISVFPPSQRVDVTTAAEADVLQIFLQASYVDSVVGGSVGIASAYGFKDPDIQALLVQMLVASADARCTDKATFDKKIRGLLKRLGDRARRSVGPVDAGPASGGLRPTATRRIEAAIEAAIERGRSLSVHEMAVVAGVSDVHFTRLFRRETGVSPHRRLVARRMEHALSLLRSPTMPVAEVADKAGYSSPAHFVAAFRSRLGVTPGAVRDAMSS